MAWLLVHSSSNHKTHMSSTNIQILDYSLVKTDQRAVWWTAGAQTIRKQYPHRAALFKIMLTSHQTSQLLSHSTTQAQLPSAAIEDKEIKGRYFQLRRTLTSSINSSNHWSMKTTQQRYQVIDKLSKWMTSSSRLKLTAMTSLTSFYHQWGIHRT